MERAQWCKDAGLSVGWLVFRNEENEQLKAGFAHLQSQLDECRKELAAAEGTVAELRGALEKIAELGEVRVYPAEWNCAKMGGSPSYEDLAILDLFSLVKELTPPATRETL